jgi:hypothetical protein
MVAVAIAVRPLVLGLVVGLSAATAGHAAGAFDCSGGSGAFHIEATLAVGPAAGGPIANAGGRLDILTRRLPSDLETVTLDREALVHHWLEGDQVNLHFYKERDAGRPFGYVEAVITTRKQGKGEADYAGRFRLKVSYLKKDGDATPVEFMTTGWVHCAAQ